MEFKIVEKRDKDRFVLKDLTNGGYACASRYTIMTLLDKGHNVVNWPYRGEICTKYDFVPNTKRSAVTFEKGIKPLKKKNILSNTIFYKKRFKTKPLFVLQKIISKAAEYDEAEKYFYKCYYSTPAARAVANKMLKYGEIHRSLSNFMDDEIKNELVWTNGPLDLSSKAYQVSTDSIVKFDYVNYYSDNSVKGIFKADESYEAQKENMNFHKTDMNVRIGSTADGRDSLYSIGRWISKIGIVK